MNFRIFEIQLLKNTATENWFIGFLNSWVFEFSNFWVFELLDFWIFEFSNFRIFEFLNFWFENSKIRKFKNSKVRKIENSKNRKSENSIVRNFENSKMAKIRSGGHMRIFADLEFLNFRVFEVHSIFEFLNFWLVSKIRKFKNSKVPLRPFDNFHRKLKNSKIRKFENPKIQEFKKSKIQLLWVPNLEPNLPPPPRGLRRRIRSEPN